MPYIALFICCPWKAQKSVPHQACMCLSLSSYISSTCYTPSTEDAAKELARKSCACWCTGLDEISNLMTVKTDSNVSLHEMRNCLTRRVASKKISGDAG